MKQLGAILLSVSLALSFFAAGPAAAARLTIGIGSIPNTPDPHRDSTANALPAYAQMFEKLVGVDDAGKVVGVLAESWRIVNETTWEFKLRRNVTFHNGEPLTSEAVKFSIERVLNPAIKSPWGSRIATVDKVEAPDSHTVRITTKGTFAPLLQGLTVVDILPPKYLTEKGDREFAAGPVGTGPFRFKSWIKQDHLALTANPTYWRGKPALDEVVFRSIPEDSTRVAGVETGELDVALLIPPEQVGRLKAKGANVQSVNQGQGMVINFRATVEPFKNKKVRQALNYAVDKEAILKNLLLGYGRILDGQVVGPDGFGYNPALKPYPYDPKRARQLLTEAGYPNGFTVKFHGSVGRYTKDKEIEEAVIGQLAEIGVTAQLEILEAGVFIQSALGATIGPIWIWAWQYLPAMDADLPLSLFHTRSILKQYANPDYDGMVARARAAINPEERGKILQEMAAFLRDDPPAIFLVQTPGIYAVQPWVQGFAWRPNYLMDLARVRVTK
jgi:peptide/nickel transport system substrate-binding protein